MHKGKAKSSQLILYPDGTLYHIDLKRSDNIPLNIFLVGAAGRVDEIAKYFNQVTFSHRNKERPEFYIVSGIYKGVSMAAMSIGIGVANVEIALNELHALFEYDHVKDCWSGAPAKVNIIRVGTAGTTLKEIPIGTLAISFYGLGLDNLDNFYCCYRYCDRQYQLLKNMAISLENEFQKTQLGKLIKSSYVSPADREIAWVLKNKACEIDELAMIAGGITLASPGFFGPEGRAIGRIQTLFTQHDFVETISNFESHGLKIVNMEMETSILFRLANEILGWRAGAICAVLDNLQTDEMIDSDFAKERVHVCIKVALEAMVALVNKPVLILKS